MNTPDPVWHSARRRATALAMVAVAAVAVVGLSGCGGPAAGTGRQQAAASSPTSGSPDPSSATPGSADPGTSATGAPTATPSGARADPGVSVPAPAASAVAVADGLRPSRIAIPAIGVDSTLTDLGIAGDGTIEVPTDYAQAGWLDTSPAPGQRGPAVVAGHVDSKQGPAVFFKLSRLSVGDAIAVTRRDGSTVTFTVDGVQRFAKSAFPTAATYGPVPGPALRLITCAGAYDKAAGGYQDNVVVFAS